ncbi:MAG TPA: PAS domain S-box protein [Chitinophagaceae bacterium]|nr:PAS domain S-box protein [Chitinophagaceae bacterium]
MYTFEFFDLFFNTAKQNSVIIMNTDGLILKVNEAFTTAFGYSIDDLAEKNFNLLFTEEDKKSDKPAKELQKIKSEGSANDDNYLVHKDGLPV